MKELYEEVIEVKFYHDPFKGYADNYILDSEEIFVDKAEYKEENIGDGKVKIYYITEFCGMKYTKIIELY